MKRVKKKQKNRAQNPPEATHATVPFIEHLYELRRRLFYVAFSIGIFGAGAYFIQQHIVAALLKPAHDQQFIYTSVGGGIDFLFRICIYTGIVFSIPVIMFQTLKYLEPLIKKDAMQFMLWGSAVSGLLALAGMAFGYFVGLPAALHFLLHQFTTGQIQALLTIQSYMSFVTLYMLGSALLFQGPLLLVLINRIKPLKPSKLLGLERWVILIAFVLGGIMNPSPRWQDQVLLAGPMIIAYQIGVLLVWLANRHGKRPTRVVTLREQEATIRAERLAKARQAQPAFTATTTATPTSAARPHTAAPAAMRAQTPANTPATLKAPLTAHSSRRSTTTTRPQQYAMSRRTVRPITRAISINQLSSEA
jgi:sec-independent protein translocase protein TatC